MRRLVRVGGDFSPAVGDRVVLDAALATAVRIAGRSATAAAWTARATGVSWSDVCGQDEAVKALREAIEGPSQHKDVYARFGKKRSKGVLLHGPAGTGKTMLGQAAATAVAELYGQGATATGFAYIKGPEIADSFFGGRRRTSGRSSRPRAPTTRGTGARRSCSSTRRSRS